MSLITPILSIASTGLSLFDQYINDPVRRLEAKQKYLDSLKDIARKALDAKDMEELDALLLALVDAVHDIR